MSKRELLVQGFGNSRITFNNNNTTDTSAFFGNMNFIALSSSLCDTLGNLVCYTNGIYIADKTDSKMINGDSLDYGTNWEQYRNDGSGFIQGGISILPIPSVKNSSVILYHNITQQPSGFF
jgi:hypothetical protein